MGWSARTFTDGWRTRIGPISPEHLNVGTRGDYMQPYLQQRNILADVLTRLRDAVASVCADGCRVYSSLGVRRRAAHDQVVDDTFMHPPGLKAGHPRHPVQSSTLPGHG